LRFPLFQIVFPPVRARLSTPPFWARGTFPLIFEPQDTFFPPHSGGLFVFHPPLEPHLSSKLKVQFPFPLLQFLRFFFFVLVSVAVFVAVRLCFTLDGSSHVRDFCVFTTPPTESPLARTREKGWFSLKCSKICDPPTFALRFPPPFTFQRLGLSFCPFFLTPNEDYVSGPLFDPPTLLVSPSGVWVSRVRNIFPLLERL